MLAPISALLLVLTSGTTSIDLLLDLLMEPFACSQSVYPRQMRILLSVGTLSRNSLKMRKRHAPSDEQPEVHKIEHGCLAVSESSRRSCFSRHLSVCSAPMKAEHQSLLLASPFWNRPRSRLFLMNPQMQGPVAGTSNAPGKSSIQLRSDPATVYARFSSSNSDDPPSPPEARRKVAPTHLATRALHSVASSTDLTASELHPIARKRRQADPNPLPSAPYPPRPSSSAAMAEAILDKLKHAVKPIQGIDRRSNHDSTAVILQCLAHVPDFVQTLASSTPDPQSATRTVLKCLYDLHFSPQPVKIDFSQDEWTSMWSSPTPSARYFS